MLDLVATIITLLFLIPMAWMIWVKVGSTGTQATSDLRLPLIPFYVVVGGRCDGRGGAGGQADLGASGAAERVPADEAETAHGP